MMGAFGPGELLIRMVVDSSAAAAGAQEAATTVNASVESMLAFSSQASAITRAEAKATAQL
jgi:hypothetical protein